MLWNCSHRNSETVNFTSNIQISYVKSAVLFYTEVVSSHENLQRKFLWNSYQRPYAMWNN